MHLSLRLRSKRGDSRNRQTHRTPVPLRRSSVRVVLRNVRSVKTCKKSPNVLHARFREFIERQRFRRIHGFALLLRFARHLQRHESRFDIFKRSFEPRANIVRVFSRDAVHHVEHLVLMVKGSLPTRFRARHRLHRRIVVLAQNRVVLEQRRFGEMLKC